MARTSENPTDRFKGVFAHYGLIVGFARRRGSGDPESIAAETFSIAWHRIADLDAGSGRPTRPPTTPSHRRSNGKAERFIRTMLGGWGLRRDLPVLCRKRSCPRGLA